MYLDKLKPIFLLFVMTVSSLGIVFVVNQFKDTSKYVKPVEGALEVKIVENSTALVNNSDTTIPQKVSEDNQGIVLSTEATNSCAQAIIKIQSYSVCSRSGTAEEDYKTGNRSGNTVSKNSTVKLIEVTIPLELFAGSDVKDSNRKLTDTTPINLSAGNMFDDKIANGQLPPGVQISEYKPSVKNRPFSMPYSTAFEQKANINSEEGEVVQDKKLGGYKCEHCKNESNVTPHRTNQLSTFMVDILYRTPGEKNQVKAEDAIESCSDKDDFIEWNNNNRKSCALSTVTVAVELIKSIPESIWSECKGGVKYDQNGNPIPPSEDCIFPEDIIIKMTSGFGSDRECPDGVCTNKYMNTRNNVALAPIDANKTNKQYFTTACKVIIEGKVYTVKCAWDMSHLYKERKFSEYDDLPGVESTPTKDQYTRYLLEEGDRRKDAPEIKIF